MWIGSKHEDSDCVGGGDGAGEVIDAVVEMRPRFRPILAGYDLLSVPTCDSCCRRRPRLETTTHVERMWAASPLQLRADDVEAAKSKHGDDEGSLPNCTDRRCHLDPPNRLHRRRHAHDSSHLTEDVVS